MGRLCFEELDPSFIVPLEHSLCIPVKMLNKLRILQLLANDLFNVPHVYIECLRVILVWYGDGMFFKLYMLNKRSYR